MRIDLDSLSKDVKSPLHQQLAELVKGAIQAGVYRPGDQIESERLLAKHGRLSQPTVARALRDLAKEGWVIRRVGSGTFVNEIESAEKHRLQKVGVFYYDTRTDYFERLYSGIQIAARAEGIELDAVPTGMHYEHEDRVIGELERREVDGIIAVPFGTELMQRKLLRLIQAGMPVVSVGVNLPHIPCDTIGFDHEMAGQLIARHLMDQQHQRIAFLCPEFLYPDTSSLEMIAGLRQECGRYGVTLTDDHIVRLPTMFHDENDPGPRRQLLSIFKGDASQRPTALVCSTDGLAHFAYMVLGDAGLRVPHDVSITGGGDLSLASQLDPPLTTVAWPLERVGRLSVRLLIDRHIHPNRQPTHRVLDTQLVLRRSTSMANNS